MIAQIFAALILGIFAGTLTGLVPGLHINLVAIAIFSLSFLLLKFTMPIVLAVFIVAMAITHTFVDFLPSIFFGAPSSDTALSVLPGHSLLLEGRGYEAVELTILGGYAALICLIVLSPLFILALPMMYIFINQHIAFILILASGFLLVNERKSRFWASVIFCLSGVLGIAALNLTFIKEPLFPLLTGLFGTSMLVSSISKKARIPKQKILSERINKKEAGKAIFASIIASPLCGFLPGLGAAQAAVIGSEIVTRLGRRGFLVLLGAINTFVMGFSFISLYIISRARTGAAVFTGRILTGVTLKEIALLLLIAFIAGSIAVLITNWLNKFFCIYLLKINYTIASFCVLIFLVFATIILSGWIGVIVLITATSLGLVAIGMGVRRMHLMGCLLIPVILYFL